MVVGIKSWALQRITAVILLIYTFIITKFFITQEYINYKNWNNFFNTSYVKTLSIITLVALLIHAWMGLWVITTDYLKKSCVRICAQIAIIIFLLTCLFCGITTIYFT